jgi:hypothetical protein
MTILSLFRTKLDSNQLRLRVEPDRVSPLGTLRVDGIVSICWAFILTELTSFNENNFFLKSLSGGGWWAEKGSQSGNRALFLW